MIVSISGSVAAGETAEIYHSDVGVPATIITVKLVTDLSTRVGPGGPPFVNGTGVYRGIFPAGTGCVVDCGGSTTGCAWEIVEIS